MANPGVRGRSLKLFLVDGTPTGVITAELGNWSGKALVAPRASLPDLVRRKETEGSGVYFLMGPDPEAAERNLVYIGETDSIRNRLVEHDGSEKMQFFTRVCCVVSKDENLTKAHGRYLESRLIELAKRGRRANLVNGTEPLPRGLPESEVADMEGFLAEIEVLFPVLGFDILRSAAQAAPGEISVSSERQTIFTFTEAGTHARAKEIAGEFVVLAGSLARAKETNTCPHGIKTLRQQLIGEGILAPEGDGERYRFTQDVAFGSPSGAGALVYGGSVNGRLYWKDEQTGKSYGELRAKELEAN